MTRHLDRRPAVDWFRILAELKRAGYSSIAVAAALSLSRSTVRNWSYGQHPRYEDGRALLMLWRRECYRLAENGQRNGVQSGDGESKDHTANRLSER